jgi:hypothetical protein
VRTFLTVTIVAAAFLWAEPATQAEESYNTGNRMLPACRAWLRMQSNNPAVLKSETAHGDAWHFIEMGICAGQVAGVAHGLTVLTVPGDQSPMACIPDGVTYEQEVRVVVNELEQRPAELHESFLSLASQAIVRTWPCPYSGSKRK